MSNIQNLKSTLLPPPLKPGDLLRVIAPSGALREVEAFNQGVEIWKSHGYRIKISDNIDNRHGYLAGTDAHRRQQLATAMARPPKTSRMGSTRPFCSAIFSKSDIRVNSADPTRLLSAFSKP